MLAAAALLVTVRAAWLARHKPTKSISGVRLELLHPCPWKDSFRALGDDRYVILTHQKDDVIDINTYRFTRGQADGALQKIFETRTEKYFFVRAEKGLSYAKFVSAVARDQQAVPDAKVILITPSMNLAVPGGSFCPGWK